MPDRSIGDGASNVARSIGPPAEVRDSAPKSATRARTFRRGWHFWARRGRRGRGAPVRDRQGRRVESSNACATAHASRWVRVTAAVNAVFLAKFTTGYKIFMSSERLGTGGGRDRVLLRLSPA